MQPLQTLKGFRDVFPEEKKARDSIISKLVEGFNLFGFEPIETPTLEYASLLLGKYGAEADKLVWQFTDRGDRQVALRYDQTVPAARFLAQYQAKLPRYFRRYQIQSNFRAEKPQRGRYREFTQADADIFGTTSPIADAEILALYFKLNQLVGLNSLLIKVNDRTSLLGSLTPFATEAVSVFSLIQSIDKLDKKPANEVIDELIAKGLPATTARLALEAIEKLTPTKQLQEILNLTCALGVPEAQLKYTPTLARGLDYYTGLIFEGFVPEYTAGSLGGGGRYDSLIGDISGRILPAVGFALGVDRTFEALQTLGKLSIPAPNAQVLLVIQNDGSRSYGLDVAHTLREAGVRLEIYPQTNDKLSKQIAYANHLKVPFVAIIGPDEVASSVVTLKNMDTGEQLTAPLEDLIIRLKTS